VKPALFAVLEGRPPTAPQVSGACLWVYTVGSHILP